MDNKDTSSPDEPQKSLLRTIPVDPETVTRVKALQDEFTEMTGGRISQTTIANRALAKVTIADILSIDSAQAT